MFNPTSSRKQKRIHFGKLWRTIISSVLLSSFALSLHAATLGLPFTEDFTDSQLNDANKTSANWDTKKAVLIQALRSAKSGVFTDLAVSSSDLGVDAGSTYDIVAGDVDGDGDIDLITGQYPYNKVFLNNGTSTPFAGVVDAEMNGGNKTLALGDIDGDGDLDLVGGTTSSIYLYLNNGSSNPFNNVDAISFSSGSSIYDIELVDVNNDNQLDIVVGGGTTNKIFVNTSSEPNPFNTSGVLVGGVTRDTYAIAIGDINNDGLPDLIEGNRQVNDRLYINNGSPTNPFSGNGIDIISTGWTYGLTLGDVDNDGDIDLIIGNYADDENRLYINDGDADPFSGNSGTFISTDADDTLDIALSDVDTDGDLDVIAGNGSNNKLYLNNGTTDPFSSTVGTLITSDSAWTNKIILVDLDNDHDVDFVAANNTASDRIYINNAGTPFGTVSGTDISLENQLQNTRAVAGDVDNDGDDDLIVANFYGDNSRLYLNNGTNTPFTSTTTSYVLPTSNATVYDVELGDVDGDGKLDIVIAVINGPNRLLINQGAAPNPYTTSEIITTDIAQNSISVNLGDLNNDGKLDLVIGGYSNNPDQVYYNDGSALPFVTGANVLSATNTRYIELADINNDGHLDIIRAASGISKLSINDGTKPIPNYTDKNISSESTLTYDIKAGDLDNDGDLDIVEVNANASSSQNNYNRYFLNDGNPDPNFTAYTYTQNNVQTRSVVLADVNSDGRLDIIEGNEGAVNRIYLNQGASAPVLFSPDQPIYISQDSQITKDIVVSDFNRDGGLDIVSSNSVSTARLYLNNAAPEVFSTISSSLAGPSTSSSTISAAVVDIDQDGDLDIISGGYNSSTSSARINKIFFNNGTDDPFFPLVEQNIDSNISNTPGIDVGDIDNDGDIDIVAGNYGAVPNLFLNDGTGTLFDTTSGQNFGTETTTWDIKLADFNNDGYLDVVTSSYDSSSENYVFINDKSTTPFSNGATAINAGDTFVSRGVAVGDVDNDGDIDIFIGNDSSKENYLYVNDGTGTAYTQRVLSSGVTADTDSTYGITVGDVNGDGYLDIVTANNGVNKLYINDLFFGSTDVWPYSAAGIAITTDSEQTYDVQLADVDSDGDLDLIAFNDGINKYYLNNGTSTPFSDAVGIAITNTSKQSWAGIVTDIDNDGKLDIIAGNFTSGSNDLLRARPYNTNTSYASSVEVDSDTDILKATLTTTQTVPLQTQIKWYLSNNGGENYYKVQPNSEFTFPAHGDDLRWKSELSSLSPLLSASVEQLIITARVDHDLDFVSDDIDICVGTADPLQFDNDNDGTPGDSPDPAVSVIGGDACDIDDDNDGTGDTNDLFPFNFDEQADTDGDCAVIVGEVDTYDYNQPTSGNGCGDTSDTDIDGDGLANGVDPHDFNIAPSISGTAANNATPDASYIFTPTVSDGGDGPSLTASLTFSGGTETNLPAWLNFNTSTGTLGGVPSNDDYGTLGNIIITVSDSVQTAELAPFNINVLDTRKPSTFAVPGTGNFNDDANINIACFENIGSGCATIHYTTDDAALPAAFTEIASTSTLVTIPASGGNKNLRFYSKDNVGNTESIKTETYNFDLVYPSVSITSPVNGSILTSADSIDGISSDTGTGIQSVAIQITDGANSVQTNGGSLSAGLPAWIPVSGAAGAWSYDTSGLNWSSDTEYTITALARDNADNETTTSMSYTYFNGTPSATSLTLSLTSASIPNGENTDAVITLTRLNDLTTDLTGVPVELHITKPDANTVVINGNTNFSGNLTFSQLGDGSDIIFADPGQYLMVAKFTDTVNYPHLATTDSSVTGLLVGSSAGYAVIVQGKLPNDDGLESHNKTANRIYDTLKDRGFVDGDIYYYNYDTNQSGVDGIPDKATIQTSIESLASEVNNRPAPVYVIFVDHGGKATESLTTRFFINDEIITPAELDSWLSTLEANMDALDLQLAIDNPRVIIIGSCYSGGFISNVSATGRIIITSATEDEQSFKGPLEDDNIRVGEYFLEELFLEMGNGNNLRDAFKIATNNTETYTKEASGDVSTNSNNEFLDTAVQHPLLDDDANNTGTNTIYENTTDGQIAKDIVLGFDQESLTNDAFNPADITSIGNMQYLANNINTANLELYANDPFQVNQAYVEIRSPQLTLSSAVENTTEQLSSNFVRRAFTPPATDGAPYTLTYESFDQAGKYEVYYYVNDRFTGALSPAKRGVVYRDRADGGSPNVAPNWTGSDLLTPTDGAVGFTTTSFDWEDAVDANGDVISYNFILADDTNFNSFAQDNGSGGCTLTNTVYKQEELNSSSTFVDAQAKLCDSSTYVWKVEAVDEFGLFTSSTGEFTYITNDTNADIGVLVAMVKSSSTNVQLTAANIFNDKGEFGTSSASVLYNGNYVLFTQNTGVVQKLSATVTGYVQGDIPDITIDSGETKEFLINLDPDASLDTDSDTVIDTSDNCPTISNTNQNDLDNDNLGDLCDSDIDGDGMSNDFETTYGLLPFDASDAVLDPDLDDQSNVTEFRNGTDPLVFTTPQIDTDGDGIFDVADNCINDFNFDQADMDNDKLGNVCDIDDDGDGMPDTFELLYSLNPLDASDADADPDGDGKTNLEEFNEGTSPKVSNATTATTTTITPPAAGGGGGSISPWSLLSLWILMSIIRRRGKMNNLQH